MLSFEQAKEALDEIAKALPEELFSGLNGGIVLLPEEKQHPESSGNLYIMGEYHRDPMGLGRYITIYYGSFVRMYDGFSENSFAKKLRDTLHHELTHHLESLAGDKTLELDDDRRMDEYRRKAR